MLSLAEPGTSSLARLMFISGIDGWNQPFVLLSRDYFDILIGFPFC